VDLPKTPWFIATERFTPDAAESWSTYIAWSRLTQLREVVSLDPMLCPPVLPTIKPEYWPYIVNEDFMLNFFVDFPYLLQQVAGIPQKNVLCVFRNPPSQPIAPAVASFEFLGYDLVDIMGSASALTNCGGFPDVFSNAELSTTGLLPGLERAGQVQARLRSLHPEEPHANCHVWAIFRFIAS
jgi:hypothetical protein